MDIILDLETLGTKPNSTITQIAAIACNIVTGEIYDTFNVYVDITKQPVVSSESTLAFWKKDGREKLFNEIIEKGKLSKKSEKEAISDFVKWVKTNETSFGAAQLWGNGPLFDNEFIRMHCEMYDLEYPILFWNDRDLRSLLEIASRVSGIKGKCIKNSCTIEGEVLHDALNDCKLELRVAKRCMDIIARKYPC